MIVKNLGAKLFFVTAFTIGAIALYIFLLTETGINNPFQKRASAFVILPDAYELVPNGDVREKGVLVGNVSSVNYEITSRGVVSKVGISLNPGEKLYRNARFQLRTKTLANENYIQLDPGTPTAGAVPQGGTLSVSHNIATVQMDQVLDTFTPSTRTAIQQEIEATGAGLNGQGNNLNALLGASSLVGQRGENVLGLLNTQRTQVANIVHDTSSVLEAFAERTQAVRTLATEARAAAVAASSRDQEIVSAVETLPSTLSQAKSTLNHLGNFSQNATPVVAKLTDVTRQATPILADLRPTAAAARVLVQKLPAALKVGKPLLAQLTPFTQKLTPTVDSLAGFLRQTDPLLSYLSPYSNDLGTFFSDNGGALGEYDAAGAMGRVFPIFSASSLTALPPQAKSAIEALSTIGDASIVGTEQTNPYPKPGTEAAPVPFSGTYPQLVPLSPVSGSDATPAR